MKKLSIILTCVFLGIAVTANAQDFKKNEISFGFGAGSNSQITEIGGKMVDAMFGESVGDADYFGPFSVEYFRHLDEKYAVGAVFTYVYSKMEQSGVEGSAAKSGVNNYYTVMPAFKSTWLRDRLVSVYSKIALGATYSVLKEGSNKDSEIAFNYQVTVGGIEFGGPIRIFAEIGYGEQGMGLIGLRAHF